MKNNHFTFLALLLCSVLFFLSNKNVALEQNTSSSENLEHFQMDSLLAQLESSGKYYLPFLNRNTLKCGIYTLPAGANDPQSPHEMDEVYYVLEGKAKFTVEDEEVAISEGDVLFVKAKAKHQFHTIEEDLKLLVFFSTAIP